MLRCPCVVAMSNFDLSALFRFVVLFTLSIAVLALSSCSASIGTFYATGSHPFTSVAIKGTVGPLRYSMPQPPKEARTICLWPDYTRASVQVSRQRLARVGHGGATGALVTNPVTIVTITGTMDLLPDLA